VQPLLDWAAGIPPLWGIAFLTLIPALELRASIPYGLLATELPAWLVVLTAVAANWLIAPLVYLALRYLLKLMLRWGWFARAWQRYSARVLARTERVVNSWGAWGLAVFIGIPLPGSGVYTGALGAYLLGMGFRRFMWVALAGVLIAAALVSLIVLSGSGAFGWLVSRRALSG
jgi:uncharacterized membrane protein